jgi:hypothetical protein
MPNDEHVALLRRGAPAWNEWRAQREGTPDLSRASLRGLDLSGFDLSQADLRDTDLRGANLSDANLCGARLEGANFFKAVLDSADLNGAFLRVPPLSRRRSPSLECCAALGFLSTHSPSDVEAGHPGAVVVAEAELRHPHRGRCSADLNWASSAPSIGETRRVTTLTPALV